MRKYLPVLLSLIPILSLAQTETAIRDHYTDVNNRIAQSLKLGYEGPLYNNHWVTNKHERSWPAVGHFTETTDFWYDDPPDHLSAADRNPRNVLLKVTVARQTVDYSADEEYLFKNGKLIFYFSHVSEEGKYVDTRVYFDFKGVMFKSKVIANDKELTEADFKTDDHSDDKPHPAAILAEAKKYQELFLKSM